jgi:hypothetical protein
VIAMNFCVPENQVQHGMDHRTATPHHSLGEKWATCSGLRSWATTRLSPAKWQPIFPRMLQDLHSAQHAITFETHVTGPGNIGKQYALRAHRALTLRSPCLRQPSTGGIRLHTEVHPTFQKPFGRRFGPHSPRPRRRLSCCSPEEHQG